MEKNRIKKLNKKSLLWAMGAILLSLLLLPLLFSVNVKDSVALDQELRCRIPAHIHSDDCYQKDILSCKVPAHSHDENCYLVLLKDNDINRLLTLIHKQEDSSLENLIGNVMSDALVLNENLHSAEDQEQYLTTDQVIAFNETIESSENLPELTFNENLNTKDNPPDQGEDPLIPEKLNSSPTLLAMDEPVVNQNGRVNFFVRLDNEWHCIGNLPYSRSGSFRYTLSLPTSEVLELVNNSLGTQYVYNDFDIAVATSQNGNYSKSNSMGIGQTTTTLATNQNSSNSQRTYYVRLIPEGGNANSTAFSFYTATFQYPDGTETKLFIRSGTAVTMPPGHEWQNGNNTYDEGELVTINSATTFVGVKKGPLEEIFINYDVGFPSFSDLTIPSKPTLAGRTETKLTEEFTMGSTAIIRNVSNQSIKAAINGNSTGQHRVIQFRGWRVNGTDTILQPNTTLVWEELLQYESRGTVSLIAVWEYEKIQTASFFIRYDSLAVDTEGNVTGQDSTRYTPEIFSSFVGGVDPDLGWSTLNDRYHLVDETPDNSYTVDQNIRALYGEKPDGVWMSEFPTDEYIFSELVQYANTGYLSVDGETVKAEDLHDRDYSIRWYVFKCQEDAWHIDGRLVKKEGIIHVSKTFAGNKTLVADAKNDFYITAHSTTNDRTVHLDLKNYVSHDQATDTYMWEINEVDYGEQWEITEHPHAADLNSEFFIYSEYNVMDAISDQSTNGSGTSVTVNGQTYALDEGDDEVLRVHFTNIYNRSDSLLIKKQDSRTGNSIGGAIFSLMQNGKTLPFDFDQSSGRYIYNPSGTITRLEGNQNGYFEISIENFSYDLGPITVREVSPPTGYTPIGEIKIGYDTNNQLGILSGNSELIQYYNGVLIIGNSTESASVTVKKNWDCPESEWREVEAQLLANGRLVTTVIAGVSPSAVLNSANHWSYTWENLPVYVNGEKITWSVREIRIGQELHKADYSFINWLVSYDLPIYSTDANGNENVLLGINNTTKRVMLRLIKTDFNWSSPLSGAVFRLIAVDSSGNPLPDEIEKNATTGDGGALIFDNLKCSIRYCLTEVSPPEGYHQIKEPIYFTINEDGSIHLEKNYYAKVGTTAYNIVVRNAEAVPLPESGGGGSTLYCTLGLLLMILSAYISIILKRRRSH